MRLGLAGVIVGLCLWFGAGLFADLRLDLILAALQELTVWQWLAGMLATGIAFIGAAGQERAVMAHLGMQICVRRGRRAAMGAAAISQTVGFGPIVGAVVRRRLLPELSLQHSFGISAALTLCFFAGIALLWGLVQAVALAGFQGLLAAVLLACLLRPARLILPARWLAHVPGWVTLARFGGWLMVDVLGLALAAWVVMPAQVTATLGFGDFLPGFLTAFAGGLASGSPAGTGVFETVMLSGFPTTDPSQLMAGIVAFRGVAYALPALLGALWAGFGTDHRPASGHIRPLHILPPRLAPVLPSPGWLRHLPRAELQLALQGELHLIRLPTADLWLRADLPGVTVHLGDPVQPVAGPADPEAALHAARTDAQREGTIACLYRIGPRLAAAARRSGMRVLPLAREAVIDPAAFTTAGAEKSGLRRKLRHATGARVTVSLAEHLPLAEMAEVARQWSQAHGGERGFSMGRFLPATLTHQPVILARDAKGSLLAFLSFHATETEWVLDLIRSRRDMPDGTLYLMLCHAIDIAHQGQAQRVSLACVPESGWGLPGLIGQVATRLTRKSAGLAQFKQAFRPRWERRYIASTTLPALAFAGLAVARAIHAPSRQTEALTQHPPVPTTEAFGRTSVSVLPKPE